MADQPCSLDLDLQQKRVAIAIGSRGNKLEPVPRSLSFHPKLVASAAEKRHVAALSVARRPRDS